MNKFKKLSYWFGCALLIVTGVAITNRLFIHAQGFPGGGGGGGGGGAVSSVNGLTGGVTISDANLSFTDITTNNSSITKHGFVPKLPNNAAQYFNGVGTYTVVSDAQLSFTDITTNNATTSAHGFLPKLPNDAGVFLNGTGAYTTPSATGPIVNTTVAGLPGTCASGTLRLATDATINAGAIKIYLCDPDNTWGQIGWVPDITGALTSDCTTRPCKIGINASIVPALASANTFSGANSFTNANTFTTISASGVIDGLASITKTTGSTATIGASLVSGYIYNTNATAATAITYTLPTAAQGRTYCFGNSWNGSAATTGTLELLTSASGQFIIYSDGTLSATGGYVISTGAAGDFACLVGVDSTHWQLRISQGTWNKH